MELKALTKACAESSLSSMLSPLSEICIICIFVLTILSNSWFPVTSVDYNPINAWNVVATHCPAHSPPQSAPANEDLQFTYPVGWAKLQSLVSCVSEEEQTALVSQMGFRLDSMPVLVGRIQGSQR